MIKYGKAGHCIKQRPALFEIELHSAQASEARDRMLQLNLIESLGIDAQRIKVRASRLAVRTHGSRNRNSGAENGNRFTEKLTRCLCNRTHFFLLLG